MKPITCRSICTTTALIVLALYANDPRAAQKFSEWSPPIHLGPLVNSDANEQGPAISRNGLSLFFGSARTDGSFGDFDIWVSHRPCVGMPWERPMNLGALINSPALDSLPSLSTDEHWMFFTSNRSPGGSGDADLWATYRADRNNDLGWGLPVNLGSKVNSELFDAAPQLTRRRGGVGPHLYFSRGRVSTALDIYLSEVGARGTFDVPAPVTELNSGDSDARPSVRQDGLEIFFYSNRPGVGLNDLWTSTRRRVTDAWSAPVNVGAPVNTGFNEVHPELSRDARTLYFASGRPVPARSRRRATRICGKQVVSSSMAMMSLKVAKRNELTDIERLVCCGCRRLFSRSRGATLCE